MNPTYIPSAWILIVLFWIQQMKGLQHLEFEAVKSHVRSDLVRQKKVQWK